MDRREDVKKKVAEGADDVGRATPDSSAVGRNDDHVTTAVESAAIEAERIADSKSNRKLRNQQATVARNMSVAVFVLVILMIYFSGFQYGNEGEKVAWRLDSHAYPLLGVLVISSFGLYAWIAKGLFNAKGSDTDLAEHWRKAVG